MMADETDNGQTTPTPQQQGEEPEQSPAPTPPPPYQTQRGTLNLNWLANEIAHREMGVIEANITEIKDCLAACMDCLAELRRDDLLIQTLVHRRKGLPRYDEEGQVDIKGTEEDFENHPPAPDGERG